MAKHNPIPKDIGDFLEVDRTVPSGLRWKVSRGPRAKAGSEAGCLSHARGHFLVSFNSKLYKSHRVIYFLETGQDPGDLQVDHKNHGDNRGELRLATNRQNSRNSRLGRNNTSGFKGVSWLKAKGKWQAVIAVNSKHKHKYLGLFDSRLDAAWAYNQAAIEFHGDFAKLNVLLVQL